MLPLAYFPTKVVFLEDSHLYLNTVTRKLDQSKREFKCFTEVGDAIDYLNDTYKPDYYLNRYVSSLEEPCYENRAINLAVYDIHNEIYNNTRFKQISTLVIDYDMPYMNGVEVCKIIKDPYIQKILLTNTADESVAIRAFNDGIIDHYIRKNDPEVLEKLEEALNKAQEKYFKLISNNIAKLITTSDWRPSALQDPAYQQLLKDIIKKYNIVEYYITETAGSYLFMDASGRSYGLFIADDEAMDALAREAFYPGSDTSIRIVDAFKKREKILCYHDKDSITLPHVDLWDAYLYPTNILEGKTTYYWAVAANTIDLHISKLLPYNAYRKETMSIMAA